MTRAALILALALPLSPLAAQETPEPLPETEEEEGFDLIEEGAKMFFRGMMQEMEPALEELQGLADEMRPALRDFAAEMGPAMRDLLAEVEDWSVYHPEHDDRQVIKDVGFDVRAGEVVGIAGLMGAGRTELAMSIFGRSWGQNISGTVEMHGQPADVSDVSRAIAAGLAYVPEDRKSLGLILDDSITRNITISNLPDVARGPVLNEHAEKRVAEKYRGDLGIRTPGVFQKVVNLSNVAAISLYEFRRGRP